MIVDDATLEKLFSRVMQVRAELGCPAGNPPVIPISIEDVQRAVERLCGVRVEKYTVLSSGFFLHSMLLRYDSGSCKILLKDGLTENEKRFASLKELAHIFLDDEDAWSTDAQRTIDGLIQFQFLERHQGEHDPENPIIVAEHLAEIAAIELAYPPELRAHDRAALDATQASYRRLSTRYGVPIRSVRLAHMRWYKRLYSRFTVD